MLKIETERFSSCHEDVDIEPVPRLALRYHEKPRLMSPEIQHQRSAFYGRTYSIEDAEELSGQNNVGSSSFNLSTPKSAQIQIGKGDRSSSEESDYETDKDGEYIVRHRS